MKKILRIAVAALVVVVVVVLGGGFFTYRATQQVPEFYEQALQAAPPPEEQQQEGDQLEQEVLALHNNVQQEGRWEATFTDRQINGWLAVDMPEKFNNLLPPGVEKPRVLIEANRARIACKFEHERFSSVVSFDLEAHLTEEPNVLAVRVRRLRAGMLPLPLKRFLDQITKAAAQADIDVRWSQTDGDPVALVRVPATHERYLHRELLLESVELRDGELYLAGRTEAAQVALNDRPTLDGPTLDGPTLDGPTSDGPASGGPPGDQSPDRPPSGATAESPRNSKLH